MAEGSWDRPVGLRGRWSAFRRIECDPWQWKFLEGDCGSNSTTDQ